MIDPLEAVRSLLLGEPGVTDLVEDRVYVERLELPEDEGEEDRAQPRAAIVVKSAGGSKNSDRLWMELPLELQCFGPSEHEAETLDNAVHEILRAIDRRMVGMASGLAFIHNFSCDAGMGFFRDGATNWPAARRRVTVRIDRRVFTGGDLLP